MKIYVDGQNTPTESATCVVSQYGTQIEVDDHKKSHLDVERLALLKGLKLAKERSSNKTMSIIISDCMIVVKEYYLNDFFKDVREEIEASGKRIFIVWQPRELNEAGIKLEKRLKTVKRSINGIINRIPKH